MLGVSPVKLKDSLCSSKVLFSCSRTPQGAASEPSAHGTALERASPVLSGTCACMGASPEEPVGPWGTGGHKWFTRKPVC